MRLTVLAHTFTDDLAEAADAARRAGFEGVVLDPTIYRGIADASRTGQREIINLLVRHGQPLVAIDVRLSTAGLMPAARSRDVGGDVDREVDRVSRAIDIARALGSSRVLCDLGRLPPAPDEPAPAARTPISAATLGRLILPDPPTDPTPPRPPIPREPAFESAVEYALRELGIRADRAGCLIAFRASLGSFASLGAALGRVDCPLFGIDLDPVALLADEWSIDDVFSRLGRHVVHVRGRDGVRGAGNRVASVELGRGHVDWNELHGALRDIEYRGTITLDTIDLPNRVASATRGASRLRALVE